MLTKKTCETSTLSSSPSHNVGGGSWSLLVSLLLSHNAGAGWCHHHRMMTGLRVAAAIHARAGVIVTVGGVVNDDHGGGGSSCNAMNVGVHWGYCVGIAVVVRTLWVQR